MTATGTDVSGPSTRSRGLMLAGCCLAFFIVSLDATIVNVALPTMQADLHASVTGLQWIIDSYTLVFAGLLLLAGSTGDRIGRRRMSRLAWSSSRQVHWPARSHPTWAP